MEEIFKSTDTEAYEKSFKKLKKKNSGAVFYFGKHASNDETHPFGRPKMVDCAIMRIQLPQGTLLLSRIAEKTAFNGSPAYKSWKDDLIAVIVSESKNGKKRVMIVNVDKKLYAIFDDAQSISPEVDFMLYCQKDGQTLFGNIINLGKRVPEICLNFTDDQALAEQFKQLAALDIMRGMGECKVDALKQALNGEIHLLSGEAIHNEKS